ncbi:membrane protein [Bordetella pertussis]|nr:membrane protein [Bordetella pertussis]CPK07865.1 membrane protein [Bordetella pertussis]CPN19243.1 membrane protein [Bordetella pertussis]CPN89120.1 membrane protein [Bordetella pertussis]CPO61378.1 membrane protein [Bordetella pertussis]
MWLALALLLANSAAAGVASHLVSYGAQAGLSPVRAGALMSAHYGLVLVARLAIGYSLDRLDKYAVLLVTTAIQIVGALLLQFTDSIAMVVAGAAAIGIGFGGYYPAYGALVQGHYPKEQVGRRLTELYLASFVAAGFGTWLVGTLFDLRGDRFDLAFFAALLLSVLALGIVLACKSRIAGHGGAKRLALPAQR